MNKIYSGLLHRLIILGFSIILQISIWVIVFFVFHDFTEELVLLMWLLSLISITYIIVLDTYPENKIPWIILIMSLPILAGVIYISFGQYQFSKKERKIHDEIDRNLTTALEAVSECVVDSDFDGDPYALRQSTYLNNIAKAPAYKNTQVSYYKLGEEKLEAMLHELKQAKKFIFLEYFIIEEGKMWSAIEEVLKEKASEGVDVRILYDDFGCLLTLPQDFSSRMKSLNIDCRIFNKFNHLYNANFNNRDHRKILVVDGNTGFTGGINLADEYINYKVKHGHWKDTAIMLKGDGVYNLTVMFLSMWSSVTEKIERFEDFSVTQSEKTDGIIQPFSDTPLDNDSVGETVYMNMLNQAKEYVYITSPYLIISHDMSVALKTAAKSGIDVRLILPGIADKKFVHFLSRSYYLELIKAGVKIYEYTPGFIHAKMFISDDSSAVVGTINLDYRSLSLHYECGVWMYQCSTIAEIKQDYLNTLEVSHQITEDNFKHISKNSLIRFAMLGLLRTFAPLM